MNFHQSFEKRIIFMPDIRKQTQTSLESLNGRLRVSHEWSLEGAMYIIHKPMVNFSGVSPPKKSQDIDGTDKTIYKAFRIHEINKAHYRFVFLFFLTILPKLYFGFK